MALKFHWPIRTQDTNSVWLAERVKMADSGAKYSALANKLELIGLNKYQKDVLNPLLKKEMCFCVCKLVMERLCTISYSVWPWERKTALFLCLLSIMEKQVTHLNTSYPHTSCHLNSHGIPAVMLGKCTVDDRKAKEGAFVFLDASPGLLLTSTKW